MKVLILTILFPDSFQNFGTTDSSVIDNNGGCNSFSNSSFYGDGYCDDELNNHNCNYDAGDCCGPNVNTKYCTECKCRKVCNQFWGDGFCNDINNNLACTYDGGDCCGSNVNTAFCTECLCLEEGEGESGGTTTPSVVTTGEGCNPDWITDGYCDDINNKLNCNYDGGDCCGSNVNTQYCTECQCYSNACFEIMRKVVMQLKLTDLGIHGLVDGAAGTFVAAHHSTLGPYYGDVGGHNWPHSSFVKQPSQSEIAFNLKMVQIIETMSNGKIKNVSLLDLPAFGSTVPWLEKNHRRLSNWPIEVNFEILKEIDGNPLALFEEFKTLLDDWKNYLTMVFKNNPDAKFTRTMEKNKFFNFTRHIHADMKTFLVATHGSQLNPAKDSLFVWRKTAQNLFGTLKDDSFVAENGLYDKLIMECTFRKNLLNKKIFDHNKDGCDSFLPTLTTNGLCHTINGQKTLKTWKKANITTEFDDLFPKNHSVEYFQGGGATEGSYYF